MSEEIVRVIYQLEGARQGKADVDALANSLDRSQGAAQRSMGALGSLSSALMSYLGFRALINDAEAGMKALIGLQDVAEVARISVAGMFQASGVGGLSQSTEDWNAALGMSADIIKRMRKDARDLPGTFQDLQNVFQGGIIGGAAAGKSALEIESLSARLMAVAKTLNIPGGSETAGRELSMMLEGRAGAHNVLWQRLKGNIGATAEEFNQFTAAEKWARVDKALRGYDHAVKEFRTTWSAISSTTADYAANILRIGGEKVFEGLKDILSEINDYYQQHSDEIDNIARRLGGELADGIRQSWGVAKEILVWIVAHKDEIKTALEAIAIYSVARMGAGVVGALAAGPAGIGGLAVGAAAAYGAATVMDEMSTKKERAKMEDAWNAGAQNFATITSDMSRLTALQVEAAEGVMGEDSTGRQQMIAHRIMMQTKKVGEWATSHNLSDDPNQMAHYLQGTGMEGDALHGAVGAKTAQLTAMIHAFDAAKAILGMDARAPGAGGIGRPTPAKANINVTNHNHFETQINQADNPDRAFVDLKKAVRDATLFPKETASQIAGVLR